jgi:hypothetical protein
VVAAVAKDFLSHCITPTRPGANRLRSVRDVGGGQTASEGFIGTLLAPSCIKLLLVGHGRVSGVGSTCLMSVISVIRFVSIVSFISVVSRHVHYGFWNAHMVQAILVGYRGVVEPRTFASLPRAGAEHAEVGATAASHMVAALFEFNHGLAVVATLPSLLFGHIDKSLSLWIFGALAAGVHLIVTQRANLCLTFGAATVLATLKLVHVGRLDPLATVLCGTVEAILCRILLILCVPQYLEFVVEQVVDVFERDVILIAALRRHVYGVLDGHGEDATET